MHTKSFERVVPFSEFRHPNGHSIWLPLVQATLITPADSRVFLSLLFDTGADITTLRADLYPMLGLQSWDQGERATAAGLGGIRNVYRYSFTLEIFDKTIECPIHLAELPPNPLFHGLLGRNTVFDGFGFGFWENTHELFMTTSP
jgi:hypothetical protein